MKTTRRLSVSASYVWEVQNIIEYKTNIAVGEHLIGTLWIKVSNYCSNSNQINKTIYKCTIIE